jgi:hypothetical protein
VDGAVTCAWAEAPAATNINVAVSTDLMRSLGGIEERAIKHICLVANRDAMVQQKKRPTDPAARGKMPDNQDLTAPC